MRFVTRAQERRSQSLYYDQAQLRYEQLVADLGPVSGLSDEQLVGLVGYCSWTANVWPSTVAAELLRGAPQDLDDPSDELDEFDARVQRIAGQVAAARGRCRVCPLCGDEWAPHDQFRLRMWLKSLLPAWRRHR